ETGWSRWLQRNARVLRVVEAAIRANGPMANADFEARRPAGKRAGWWDWKPAQHALHYLWMTGALTVHSRRHFHKRFDLMERAFPGGPTDDVVSADTFLRWPIERSLHALGAAPEPALARYLSFPRQLLSVRRAALRAMIERGEVVEIGVAESPGRWLALARDLPALARAGRPRATSRGTTLLSPFDSLLWHRERARCLFGFDYRIEVYTPGPQRVHAAGARIFTAAAAPSRSAHRPARCQGPPRRADTRDPSRALRAVVRRRSATAGWS